MPSRSFYRPSNFQHIEKILLDAHPGLETLSFENRSIAPLIDEASLAQVLGISTHVIYGIIGSTHKHYREFEIKQKNKKIRTICAPRTYLKVIQWWILDNILYQKEWPEFVMGFVKGKSPIINARHHMGAKHLLNIDIKDFFPSITVTQTKAVFLSLGYKEKVVDQLCKLTTYKGALPQGAPTSPAIANFVCRDMDNRLFKLSNDSAIKYTRYADDLTFSSQEKISPGFLTEVIAIIEENNFRINTEKTHFSGKGNRMDVTGFVINEKIQLPYRWRNRIRAIFHQAALNPKKYMERYEELKGYLAVIQSYHNGNDAKLIQSGLKALEKIKPISKE